MSLTAAAIGGAAAIAGSAGSAMIGNAGNRRAVKAAARYNLAQWHRENEYNHPSQQMSRLADAGLNPNLIYGSNAGGAAGNATGHPKQEVASYQPPNFMDALPVLQAYSDFRVKNAQTDNLIVQNDLLEAQALTEAARTSNIIQNTAESSMRTAKTDFELGMAKELKNTNMDIQRQNLVNLRNDSELKRMDYLLRGEDLKYRPLQRESVREQIGNMKADRQLKFVETALKRYELGLNERGIQKNDNVLLRNLFGETGILNRMFTPNYEYEKRMKDATNRARSVKPYRNSLERRRDSLRNVGKYY